MYKKSKKFFFKKNKIPKINYINWRFAILCGFIFISLSILTARIIFLQIINPDYLISEGDRRTLRIESILNTRGIINDRFGYPLAVTVPVNAICANPEEIFIHKENINQNPRWHALSKVLSIPLSKIIENINLHKKLKFIYLARQTTPEIGEYIKQLKLPGVFLLSESKRYYPSGEILAHLIGVTNIDGIGIEGVEKSFNALLTGKPGKRKIRKDKKGRIVENILLIKKSLPDNITLSIDKTLQNIVYNKLKKTVKDNQADAGTAILLDIETGEVLAMANSPSYNPNNMSHIIQENIRNRAITDMFEPGSTVKPIVIMEGLKLGVIKNDSIIQTEPYFINQHRIKDVSYHQNLSITGILQKSSNVGVSKIATSIPFLELIDSYSKFGLGKPTKLGLIGEKDGVFPNKKYWSNLERATFSFGYGLMVTPLQLARLYATIGSYGIYRPLSIIKIQNSISGERVFPEKYVKDVIDMMESVAKPGGGGTQAAVAGYRVAVKTGTAKKVGARGAYIHKYIAYTAGIAPASHPKFALIIMIDNPQGRKYYGGSVSAPIFGEIMQLVLKTMNIPPDNVLNKNI